MLRRNTRLRRYVGKQLALMPEYPRIVALLSAASESCFANCTEEVFQQTARAWAAGRLADLAEKVVMIISGHLGIDRTAFVPAAVSYTHLTLPTILRV